MNGFVKVAQGVYHLSPPNQDFGSGVTLVTGVNNILIDCGAMDYSVSRVLVPALKELKLDIKNIDYLLFTHCDPENMGGVHKLKQLCPSIKIMSYGYQTERLKNPSYYFMNRWNDFLDYSPPFRELRGLLVNGTVDAENRMFSDLKPIFAQGHSPDSVCWYHTRSQTLICGDAVQGGGTAETGIAFITSLQYYKNTLSDLIETSPENMVCGRDFKNCPSIINGRENCIAALESSYDQLSEYSTFIERYSKLTRKRRENMTAEEVTMAYFEGKDKPQVYGYAMHTFSEFLKQKR